MGWLFHLLQFGLGLLAFVCVHETGHVLLARAFGYSRARFHLILVKNGKTTFAVTDAPLDQFSDRQNIVVSLAGVLLTRLTAGLLLLMGQHLVVPEAFKTLLISFFLLCRTDLFLYTLRNLLGTFWLKSPQHDQDISLAVRFLKGVTGWSEPMGFSLIFAVALLDLLLGIQGAASLIALWMA